MYLETSQVPVRYILACRKILYLHGLVQRSDGELVKKVYLVQKKDPTDGDFCQLVAKDLQMIDLHMTENQVAVISYFDFKKLVKMKARQSVFKHLMAIKETKPKMDNIMETISFMPQPYIVNWTRKQASLMLTL